MDNKKQRALEKMVQDIKSAAGDALVGMVLHGAEARGDHYDAARDLYLLVVLRDLEPETLRKLGDPVSRWLRKGHPMPRFFTPQTIADSADTFPIELLDIAGHKQILCGEDAFGEIEVDPLHLRLQCERELREKLMRLQEGYVEARGRRSRLAELLVDSYLAFVDIFRGCLRLREPNPPARSAAIVGRWCEVAELDPGPFQSVERLARGETVDGDLEELFSDYYRQLKRSVEIIDQFTGQNT